MTKPSIIPQPEKIQMEEGISYYDAKIPPEKIQNAEIGKEGYILTIKKEGIEIQASDDAGFFYGIQTLEQLAVQYNNEIPCMIIKDAPKYPYRSFHLDSARHFIPIEELKKNIACASAFKLNHFHWHFSDDQGYRIESKVFPLLTEISSKRCGDYFGSNKEEREEQHYYTQQQVKEIVQFAADHYIEVVPEIDMPGHVTAILAAYPQLSCEETKLSVATREGIYSDILCAGKDEVYSFMEKLLEELIQLFPGTYFHIGGDETPKSKWKTCACCQKKMQEEGLENEQQLQGYMQNRIASFLKSKGKTAIAWNEAALGENLDTDIVLQLWNDDPKDPAMKAFKQVDENGKPTGPNQGIGARFMKAGGRVISSNMLNSYCDYPHAFVKAKNIYETDILPQKCDEIADARARVLGGEALCWTEHIRTPQQLEYMIWPRFAAKADNLWSQDANKEFKEFTGRMKALYPFFAKMGIQAASMKEFIPGPITSGKQMMNFLKNLGGNNADEYAKANKEI